MIKLFMYCFDFSVQECPGGSSGVNCTKACPTNCSIDQFLYMVDGCLQTERDTENENSHQKQQQVTTTFSIYNEALCIFFLETFIQHV